jgi:hypothetical protein
MITRMLVARKKKNPRVSTVSLPVEKKKSNIRSHIFWIVLASIFTKLLILYITIAVFHSFIDTYDISWYYSKGAVKVLAGQIPYVDFAYDYPQGALISTLFPLLISTGIDGYTIVHMLMMIAFDIGTAVLVYLTMREILDEKRAFFSGLLCAVSFASAYFAITKYDAFPTFLMIASLYLIVKGRGLTSYLTNAFGYLVKWFPLILMPFFVVRDYKNGLSKKGIIYRVGAGIALIAAAMFPFAVLNFKNFMSTYTVSTEYRTLTHSFPYLINYVTNSTFFDFIRVPLMGIIMLGLLYWYYKSNIKGDMALVYVSFFSIFTFVILNQMTNPQYFVWLTPLFAMVISTERERVFYLVSQCLLYIEFPLSYNVLYDNVKGYFGNAALILFIAKFVILGILVYLIGSKVMRPAGVEPATPSGDRS